MNSELDRALKSIADHNLSVVRSWMRSDDHKWWIGGLGAQAEGPTLVDSWLLWAERVTPLADRIDAQREEIADGD